jgi:plasmid stabilization system protein ParE
VTARQPELHPEAVEEAEAGLRWYAERSPLAADRFLAALDRAINRVCEAPERWPENTAGTRRYVMLTFPYAIVYKATEDRVVIYAIAHTKRRPGYWRDRLE